MKKRRPPQKAPKKALDRFFEKRGPGRPGARRSEVRTRADHYRLAWGRIWDKVREPLLKAQTKDDVIAAFRDCTEYDSHQFVPVFADLILQIIRERKFPKRSKPQMNFLADSLAGCGEISPRRSRDICYEERAKDVPPSPHKIIRREFYVECTCGYKGPARDNACKKCGAVVPDWPEIGKGNLFK
jgi:hypothetical protein